MPLLGFVVAGIHEIAGNHEHAARALAKCANSSVVCVGVVIGFMLGETMGSVIGAGIATPIGIWIETEIKDHLIEDPMLLAQFEEATLGRYIGETLLNMGMAAIPGDPIANITKGAGNEAFKQTLGIAVKNYTRQVVAGMRSSVATTEVEEKVKILLSGYVFTTFLFFDDAKRFDVMGFCANDCLSKNSIGDLIKGDAPSSWSDAEEKVKKVLKERGAQLANTPPMVNFHI